MSTRKNTLLGYMTMNVGAHPGVISGPSVGLNRQRQSRTCPLLQGYKNRLFVMKTALLISITLLLSSVGTAIAQPVGTSFTYQGELQVLDASANPIPADGEFDFVFTLFDEESGGSAVGTPFTSADITVIDGIFIIEMDFGVEPYTGDQLWLQVEVRDGAATGAFTELTPRQPLTAAPFAILSELVAEGSVGELEVVPSEVQLRIADSCPAGSSIRTINEDGSVICEADSDEQTLSLTDTTIAISNGNSVDLSAVFSDSDANNELNTGVTFDGTNLTVSDAGGDLSADLSALVNDDNNELNTGVAFDGSNLSVTDAGGTQSADLSALANDDTNELNTGISFAGDTLTISDAGGDQSVVLTGIVNNDINELNTGFVLTGTTLSVIDAGGTLSADLSGFLDNTDEQTLSVSGTNLSISGGNAIDLAALLGDTDPANELNTAVSFDGTNLTVTDANGTLSADLSSLNESAAEILARLITVDGAGSGLDADLLDGMQASDIIAAAAGDTRTPISTSPFTITEPGSYIVTQDLINTVDDTDVIRVEASDVTVDLGGFRLTADMTPDDNIVNRRQGIFVSNGNSNVRVMNGHVDSVGADGIDAAACTGCIFENLTITNSRFAGLVTGESAVVSNVIASFNGDDGIEADNSTVIAFSTVQGNGNSGFASVNGSTRGLGISIINCTAFENEQAGFELDEGATVIGSVANDNLEQGFDIDGNATVQESSAFDNGLNGFDIVNGMLRDNVAAQNGTLATSQNDDNGFRVSANSYLINNHAYENDGAGIRVTSSDVTIENNTAIDNDRAGIESRLGDTGNATTGSLYIRNRAAGNSTANFDIAAGNSFGPIIDIASGGDISSIANADHPMANFEY